MFTSIRQTTMVCFSALVVLISTSADAQTSSDQRGPAPTESALLATSGAFAIKSVTLAGSQTSGFGSTTVYYPTDKSQGAFGVVVLCPGIGAIASYYSWLATRVASWGFVVVNMNPRTIADFDAQRASAMLAALKSVGNLSQNPSSPLYGRIDPNRKAVIGHSMGGGGVLNAGQRDPSLLASVALAPGGVTTSTSSLNATKAATLIVGFDKDVIVAPGLFAGPYYTKLPNNLDAAYLLMQGNHMTPTLMGGASQRALIGKITISWLKRFVDQDTRYDSFVQSIKSPLLKSYKTQGPDLS